MVPPRPSTTSADLSNITPSHHSTTSIDSATVSSAKRPRRGEDRVAAACNLCKSRKVKCDGNLPCSYCCKKSRGSSCVYSGPRSQHVGPNAEDNVRATDDNAAMTAASDLLGLAGKDHEDPQDTAVPLEARLLRDAQGKMIFIGDCAPLSFLQTVRQSIAAKIPSAELPSHLSRDAFIEMRNGNVGIHLREPLPLIDSSDVYIYDAWRAYYEATSGLVDFFDDALLEQTIDALVDVDGVSTRARSQWQSEWQHPAGAVLSLVIAIGLQELNWDADLWFEHGKAVLLAHMNNDMTIDSVRGFVLASLYMLRAKQPNAAYLNLGLAARCGYTIGLHRTEVNASFGAVLHNLRDRTWKSLRVVDMLISNMLGRPTSSADIDCTIPYQDPTNSSHKFLDASIQIFLVIERIVLEVYSRKCISLRIAGYISHQIKVWATKWLPEFSSIIDDERSDKRDVLAACRCLCSYHYSIMLLTRPFLIYQLHDHLGASTKSRVTHAQHRDKTTYAKAALHAASTLVDIVLKVIFDLEENMMGTRRPMILSWLFTASLVLVVGMLGQDGPTLLLDCRKAIECLKYFADNKDPHAQQHLKTVKALFEITKTYALEQESRLHEESKRASSALFGLYPGLDKEPGHPRRSVALDSVEGVAAPSQAATGLLEQHAVNEVEWTPGQEDIFALPWLEGNDVDLQSFLQPNREGVDGGFAGIPLFPIFD